MSFLSPLSLLIFLPLGAVIIVLYLLKLKRKERLVSSTLMWQESIADIQANAPFQKLKKNLLLFLQLLAALAIVLDISRPFVRTKGLPENKMVVILDASASMQSRDVSPSRFEAAKARAAEIVQRMGPGDTMLIITADTKTRVVATFTSDKRALTGAMSRLKPTDTRCNIRQAITLALSLVRGKSASPPRILILSDGGFGSLPDVPAGNARIDFLRVGKGCDNVAITGVDSRKTLAGDQQVFIGLRNYAGREHQFNLEIYLDDHLIDVREERLRPGEMKQEIIKNTTSLGGRVTAKLDIDDDLQVDNSGWVYLTKHGKVNVLLVSDGNTFLQSAVNLDPRAVLTRSAAVPADLTKPHYDLVIFDGKQPPSSLPPGGYLLINSASAQGPAEMASAVNRPTIVESAQNHPATASVDFSNIKISKACYLKPRLWANTLVDSDGGPLVVAGTQQGRRFVQLSFNLLESDFPLRVGFPIFVTNCLDWLVPPAAREGQCIRTGSPEYIDVPLGVAKLTVTQPDGTKHDVNVTQSPVIYDDTGRCGVYHVSGKGIDTEFACNLASSEESSTKPKQMVTIGRRSLSAESSAVETNREFYGPLILSVLGLLTFEWYAYHRRL